MGCSLGHPLERGFGSQRFMGSKTFKDLLRLFPRLPAKPAPSDPCTVELRGQSHWSDREGLGYGQIHSLHADTASSTLWTPARPGTEYLHVRSDQAVDLATLGVNLVCDFVHVPPCVI